MGSWLRSQLALIGTPCEDAAIMKTTQPSFVVLAILAGTCAATHSNGDVRVTSVISDHMVLQQGREVPIWGLADPGESVGIRFGQDTRARTTADADGKWMVRLGPFEASASPRTLTIAGKSNEIKVHDILVGEVWVCSGQSNMQWSVRASANPESERSAAHWPEIRMFTAAHVTANEPQFTVPGGWQVCSPSTVSNFSAVGYYFGRDLYQELNVPIGLIHTSWGGTRAEPWTSGEALAAHPRYAEIYGFQRDAIDAFRQLSEAEIEAMYEKAKAASAGAAEKYWNAVTRDSIGKKNEWHRADLDTSEWREMELPGLWEASGLEGMQTYDGFVWFQRTIDIPASWEGHDLQLRLGKIDDADITWFNGKRVGQTIAAHMKPRIYTVPAAMVEAGTATITCMALDTGGAGGVNGPANEMDIAPIGLSAADRIALNGAWKFRKGGMHKNTRAPAQPARPQEPGLGVQNPAALYNAMINPIVPYGVQGAIWYQGESNANEADAYRELLPLMIQSWRDAWQQDSFPFGIVQLASFRAAAPNQPAEGGWAYLRDAQLHTAQTVADTGLAIAIDIGEANDIHPKNKQDVGHRLALWARATVYDHDIEYAGPTFEMMEASKNTLRVTFSHADGLTTRDGAAPNGFAIAGDDGTFVWAKAKIDGNSIVVWHDDIRNPVAVRYAWQNNPVRANVINAAGLPAGPFKTD